MVLVVGLVEVTAGGLVVGALAEATLAALAEAVDSMAEVTDSMVEGADSMAAGTGSTVQAGGFMGAAMETGPTATTGTMGTGTTVTTGIMAIVGVMGTTGTTGTTMDIGGGAGAAGGIRGTTAGAGIIRGTVPTLVTHTAVITVAETTELDMESVQELLNCSADFREPGITTALLMEQWVLVRGELFAPTSATMDLEIAVHQR